MNNNFLIGVATSSHQNEGNNFYNNWWNWEIINKLERSGIACNSWNDYKKDIDCVKELGCNSYRFSIEWSRICPHENKVDFSSLKKYEDMIDYCKKLEIEPIVTLHHFTRPKWIDYKYGGLHNVEFIAHFKKYVKLVCKKFAEKVKWWITFNEPMLECVNGYIRGNRPPGFNNDFNNMYKALVNIIDAHCYAYDIIKKYNKLSMISISKNLVDFEKQYYYDIVKSKIEDQIINNFNWGILDALYFGNFSFGIGITKTIRKEGWIGKLDYLGINHYNVGYIDLSYSIKQPINVLLTSSKNNYKKNALNWDIKPESLKNVIDDVIKRYGDLNILITESGSCEKNLISYESHFMVMDTHLRTAIKSKNIIGYMWWTLVDNFEWDDGYLPKFGLYSYDDNERKIKKSGLWYSTVIKNIRR